MGIFFFFLIVWFVLVFINCPLSISGWWMMVFSWSTHEDTPPDFHFSVRWLGCTTEDRRREWDDFCLGLLLKCFCYYLNVCYSIRMLMLFIVGVFFLWINCKYLFDPHNYNRIKVWVRVIRGWWGVWFLWTGVIVRFSIDNVLLFVKFLVKKISQSSALALDIIFIHFKQCSYCPEKGFFSP